MKGGWAPLLLTFVWCLSVWTCANVPKAAGAPKTQDVIAPEELASAVVGSASLFEAIQRLRPAWLRTRGPIGVMHGADTASLGLAAPTYGLLPAVAVNQMVSQNLDILHSVPVGTVKTVRFLTARDATTRYGPDFVNGLIDVTTQTVVR